MSELAPLRCPDAAPYLSHFADGELAEPMQSQVITHLARCGACRQEVARHRNINAAIASLPQTEPSPNVLTHVLAATDQQRDDLVARQPLWVSKRRRLPRTLPSFLTNSQSYLPSRIVRVRRRPGVLADAIPAIAALLVVALALLAFHITPIVTRHASPEGATSQLVMRQTRGAVAALNSKLTFTAALPTYLPTGAQLQLATLDQQDTNAEGYALDVSWSGSGSIGAIHLREAPIALSARHDLRVGASTNGSLMAWQITSHPWHAITMLTDSPEIAVGQDRGPFSVSLAIDQPIGSSVMELQRNLRLISLSMDTPYQPITITPGTATDAVLHYQAQASTASGILSWDVWNDPMENHWQVTLSGSGKPLYTDIFQGKAVLRLDATQHAYQALSPQEAGDVGILRLPNTATRFFLDANSFVHDGEWWNMGVTSYHGQQVYMFAVVSAASPTFVYVGQVSRRVVALKTVPKGAQSLGGVASAQVLQPGAVCPAVYPNSTFSLIEYVLRGSSTTPTFSTDVPSGYVQQSIASAVSCA